MRIALLGLVLCAGCTNAPITGLMDHFHPSRPMDTLPPREVPARDAPALAPPVR